MLESPPAAPERRLSRHRGFAAGVLIWLLVWFATCTAVAQTNSTALASQLVEFAGKVEVARADGRWLLATNPVALDVGDRIRTGNASRATLQLSDRSVIRLDQNTVLEIQPPTQAPATRKFRLNWGRLFFLNRERPAAVEFETPLTVGAIRGTEFLLEAAPTDGATGLSLFDGAVELRSGDHQLALASGQRAEVAPNTAPRLVAALPLRTTIQWAFYYPAVVVPADLRLAEAERLLLMPALDAYRAGDLLGAFNLAPAETQVTSESARTFLAALKLAVGRIELPTPANEPASRALRELIAAVTQTEIPATEPTTASEWLARSYSEQAHAQLEAARAAARRATELAPGFGPVWIRLAELEFSFGERTAVAHALAEGRRLAPRHAQAFVLAGSLKLEEHAPAAALAEFEHALELDRGLPSAWSGRGLALAALGHFAEARRDFQVAAALEPQRGNVRSQLGRAFAAEHADALAGKEFRIAKELDPADPTAWLYSALHRHQLNGFNEAARELATALDKNDNRALFRSRLLLDQDRALRSADLAALYADLGLEEASQRAASSAVDASYSDYAGHLFLARSLQRLDDVSQFEVRFETPRESELLLANLLAPADAASLSRHISPQAHLSYFAPRAVGFSSQTEYRSNGDWEQTATLHGNSSGLSYALDAQYLGFNGQQLNAGFEHTSVSLQVKQDLSPADGLYFQLGWSDGMNQDIAQRYDPTVTTPGFRGVERQLPQLYAGYHHAWAPGSHTLLLVGHLEDDFSLTNPQATELFLRQSGGQFVSAHTDPFFRHDFRSDFNLTSVEVQQLWETSEHAVIVGARYQVGEVGSQSVLTRTLTGVITDQALIADQERLNGYGYYQWRPLPSLRFTAGLAYDHLTAPRNLDFPPLGAGEQDRSLVEPKAALQWSPWKGGTFRAAFARSLGGLYFDNSVRLEPTQLAGFTTAYRSLIPISVIGLASGTEFDTLGVGFDQTLGTDTWLGVTAERLTSSATREVGALTNTSPLPIPDATTSTHQSLDFEERTLSAYANRLVGLDFAFGVRYRLSEANLDTRFPDLPANLPGVADLAQNERAVLGQLSLLALWNHPSGWFAQWQSAWWHQNSDGYTPALVGDDFWQHDVFIGYRFPRRLAEIRLGLLNLTDQDYRLNPLNLHADLPRSRTVSVSLKLNF